MLGYQSWSWTNKVLAARRPQAKALYSASQSYEGPALQPLQHPVHPLEVFPFLHNISKKYEVLIDRTK